ncbi:MAG TPA: DUF962 domain-containing protein [Rhodanobacteraceae bacterium]
MWSRYADLMRYASFREFYPFYLSEHSHRVCRRLHFVGSLLVIAVVGLAISTRDARWLWLAPIVGYGFAWIGHFFFERNRPATFKYPLWSFAGDWVMFWDILRRRVSL